MFRYDIIWDKQLVSGFLNAKRMPLRVHEQIAIFYKKPPVYNPQFEIGNPSHNKGTKHLTKEAINNNYGEYKSVAYGNLVGVLIEAIKELKLEIDLLKKDR
jgi:hypothetical protein